MLSRIKHTPTTLQMEAVECGAASLSMILKYYGKFVPLAQLRHECGVSRDGSKASNVLKAARLHGLKAKGFSKNLDKTLEIPCPFIAFWEFNHFLVVEAIQKEKNRVYLNDPAVGHRKLTWDEFDKGFTGVVLTFEPEPTFQKGGRQPNALPGLWRRLRSNLTAVIFALLAGLLLILPGVAIPTFTRVFLDSVIVEGRLGWYRPLIVAMLGTVAMQLLLTAAQLVYLRRLKIGLCAKLSSQFYSHLLKLPIRFYTQRHPGEIVNRSTLNDKLAGVLSGQLASTFISLFTMVIYAAVMCAYSVKLTLIGVVSAALNIAALQWISKSRVEANMRLAKEQGLVSGITIAGIQGIETLKASGTEDAFFGKWAGYNANASNASQKLADSTATLNLLPTFLETVTNVLVLILGGFMVIRGEISIGLLVGFQGLMGSFLEPVSALLALGSTLQELQGDVLRLDDVLDNAPAATGAPPRGTVDNGNQSAAANLPIRLEGRVEVRNLSFGYSPLEKPLIDNFSMVVEPGQRVALVGGSGSGKSTIAKIICGLYEPTGGEILFDGIPYKEVPRDVLANSLAMVEQEIFLFEGPIRDNLTLWDKTIPDHAIMAACEDAAVADIVAGVPGALDGVLQEAGGNLSGGQRQRLEIARALVVNPSILVMDEATSALDSQTEVIVDENIRRRGCTCIIVAHRLSTIRDCDEIIVLEKGKVVERGTHEQLWEQGGFYAQLIRGHEESGEESQPELQTSS